MYDFAVIGGGIVGLSTAMALGKRFPKASILLLEKEEGWAKHQTGHNSGVIHSGIYYRPGSLKAQYATAGCRSMTQFCQEYGIEHEICGKVIVATEPEELPVLDRLLERGQANGLAEIRKIGPEVLREIEPHAAGLAAIHVPMAGIVNYVQVCETYARLAAEQGATLRTGARVVGLHERPDGVTIETATAGSFQAKFVVNCAGLHADRVAAQGGVKPDLAIVPFRGEYYELKPERRKLVRGLIYPAPNPQFPFLGVHFTKMVGGHVEAGPNAVLALHREGYRKSDFSLRDTAEVLSYPGFWRLASKHWRYGWNEFVRSFSKAAFVRSLQRLVPEITADDLEPAPSGVRAQAIERSGALIDDFALMDGKRALHVYNAPSPAATASLEIGKALAARVPQV